MNEKKLEVRNVTKNFGGVRALNNVSMELHHNEVLAIVGDNGAGKSTLMKIISGAIIPDSGEIFFEGKKVNIQCPQDSINLGIQMCYQHLALVDALSISKNLFLGREITRKLLYFLNFLRVIKMKEKSIKHLKKLGITLKDIDQEVKYLSGGQRQVIAISRAVFWSNNVIILDEPTAALGIQESKKVNDLISSLKNDGISVIMISHNLQHVFKIADRIMVLRQGANAGTCIVNEVDGDKVVRMITGAEFSGKTLERTI